METVTYQSGTWKAEAHAEELASGKFQGVVLLFNDQGSSTEQIMHRAIDVSDTPDGALEEAKALAQRVLHDK
ncbi:MAG TPA: hypothetical protein VEC35_20055 [Noviherbaspirillum sp.]|nr:hypothetical protein [Noviherbaspirillum sp.]